MNRFLHILSAALLLAAAGSGAFGIEPAEAQEILEDIDAAMSFAASDFAAVMTMITEDPEAGIEKRVLQQYRRDRDDKFLILFQEPATQKGQGYLNVGDNLWFYDPESRKFSHTSMKEQFAGTDANNSDFRESTLAEDYRVTEVSQGTLGRYGVYIMSLQALTNEVTYPQRKIWVTTDTRLVLKSEDYSANGRLMRTSLIPAYARVEEKYIATRLIFVDNLIEGKKTQITLTDISFARLADSVFTKAYVERVNR